MRVLQGITLPHRNNQSSMLIKGESSKQVRMYESDYPKLQRLVFKYQAETGLKFTTCDIIRVLLERSEDGQNEVNR